MEKDCEVFRSERYVLGQKNGRPFITVDGAEYFDEGHEWWGALCLTVYDETLDRFAVIMASATD